MVGRKSSPETACRPQGEGVPAPRKKSPLPVIVFTLLFAGFLIVSRLAGFKPGREMGLRLQMFGLDMLRIVPAAFILIGLFEVWVKRETVERHLGEGTVLRGYFWAILLAGTTVGGLYVAFPVACALYRKGARLSVIFTYLGTSGTCRIPMTVFEASFLGLPFTLIRFAVAVPLIIFSSILLEKWLRKREYAPRIVDE